MHIFGTFILIAGLITALTALPSRNENSNAKTAGPGNATGGTNGDHRGNHTDGNNDAVDQDEGTAVKPSEFGPGRRIG